MVTINLLPSVQFSLFRWQLKQSRSQRLDLFHQMQGLLFQSKKQSRNREFCHNRHNEFTPLCVHITKCRKIVVYHVTPTYKTACISFYNCAEHVHDKKNHISTTTLKNRSKAYLFNWRTRKTEAKITKKAGQPVARNISQWNASCNGLKWIHAPLPHTFQPLRRRPVFTWLSKELTRLRLLCLVIGLKISRRCFHQWEANPNPIVPGRCDFSRPLSKLQVIATNSDWSMALFAPVVIGRSTYFGIGFFTVTWKPPYLVPILQLVLQRFQVSSHEMLPWPHVILVRKIGKAHLTVSHLKHRIKSFVARARIKPL